MLKEHIYSTISLGNKWPPQVASLVSQYNYIFVMGINEVCCRKSFDSPFEKKKNSSTHSRCYIVDVISCIIANA